jgi:hypothetical protein
MAPEIQSTMCPFSTIGLVDRQYHLFPCASWFIGPVSLTLSDRRLTVFDKEGRSVEGKIPKYISQLSIPSVTPWKDTEISILELSSGHPQLYQPDSRT